MAEYQKNCTKYLINNLRLYNLKRQKNYIKELKELKKTEAKKN